MSSTKRKLDSEHLASRDQLKHKAHKLDDYSSNSLHAHSCDVNSDNEQTATSTKHHHAEKPFRFLDLAAELRNSIYSFALEGYPAARIPKQSDHKHDHKSKGTDATALTLASDCPLVCVSKQIHKELKSMLLTEATRLQTTVHDFDFTHIIIFFDNLSDKDFNNFIKSSDAADSAVKVRLNFTAPSRSNGTPGEGVGHTLWRQWIMQWKRGGAVNIIYEVGYNSSMSSYYGSRIHALRREERKKWHRKKGSRRLRR